MNENWKIGNEISAGRLDLTRKIAFALNAKDAKIEQMRVALKYGRDCVMESFEHVKDNDDQVMADARLQAIDAALGHQQSAAEKP